MLLTDQQQNLKKIGQQTLIISTVTGDISNDC
jgi:hypothetical protein